MNEVQNENTTPVMSTEEKIKNLEERVAHLEKIERDRRTRKIIMICLKVAFYLIIFGIMIFLLLKLKTYYDQLNNLKNFDFSNTSLGDFDLSNYFQGLFNR